MTPKRLRIKESKLEKAADLHIEGSKWFALRTMSRHERKIDTFLGNQSFETFLPLTETWSRRKDRKKKIETPLFPGYLFIHCSMDQDSQKTIVQAPGVVEILRKPNGSPAPIPPDQIDTIIKIVSSGAVPRDHSFLKRGDKVIVTEGQMEGAIGFYISSDTSKGCLVVSVDMLGRSVEVDMEEYMVEKF